MAIKNRGHEKLVACLALVLLAVGSCATLIRFQMDTNTEWLEGKPYPIEFTISDPSKAVSVVINYRINFGETKAVRPTLMDKSAKYLIPAAEVVAGELEYFVIAVDADGKEHKSALKKVAILTREQALNSAKKNLSERISVAAPEKAPVILDLAIDVRISAPKPGTTCVFHYRLPGQGRFNEQVLEGDNGKYRALFTKNQLAAGTMLYFVTVSEQNADFGKIEVTYPATAPAAPRQTQILGTAELQAALQEELQKSLVHTPVKEAYMTRDLVLTLTLTYPAESMLSKLSTGNIRVEVAYGRFLAGSRTATSYPARQAVMEQSSGRTYSFSITSSDLFYLNINAYHFTVTDEIPSIGAIRVTLPPSSTQVPFIFEKLNIDQIRARITQAVRPTIVHKPVTVADGLKDIPIQLEITNPDYEYVVSMHLSQPGERDERVRTKKTQRGVFSEAITLQDLADGYTQYYFVILIDDKDTGGFHIDYPENGKTNPFSFSMLNPDAVRRSYEEDIFKRIKHTPVTSVYKGQNLSISFTIEPVNAGTKGYLCYRRGRDATAPIVRVQAAWRGNVATAVLPKQEIADGVDSYFIEIMEVHPYLGTVIVYYPKNGDLNPIRFRVIDPRDEIMGTIEFSPVKTVLKGSGNASFRISIKHPAPALRVQFFYRISGSGMTYVSVPMTKNGNNFFAEIPDSFLQPGESIDYYFLVAESELGVEFKYPEEARFPFTLSITE